MSNYRDWILAKLTKRFKLKREIGLNILEEWIKGQEDITDFEFSVLNFLRKHLQKNVLSWNEQELSMHAIGPIFTLVDFTTDNSNLFELRELSGTIDAEEISGKPDGMIASGTGEPEVPYFCFHEYKKESDPNGDPTGQCLAAMLVAQSKNEISIPIYGVTIVGENWRFLVLQANTYDISNAYSAASEDLYTIFSILKRLKKIIAIQIGV